MTRQYAVFEFPAECHVVPVETQPNGYSRSDRRHAMTPDCDCRPVVWWKSDAAPRPLYEHRDALGLLCRDEGLVS